MTSLKFAFAALILAPAVAFAAPTQTRKKTQVTTTKTQTTSGTTSAADADTVADQPQTSRGTIGGNGGFNNLVHDHLSLFANFDFADSFEVSSQKVDAERALVLGAQYAFDQFADGVNVQVGGTYDFSREIKNAGGLKVQEWTTFGELAAHVTPAFQVMGGLNYNFPNLSNAAPQASIKGKIGYQVGASFQVNEKFAIDGRYRALEMELSAPNGAGGTTTSTAKISGLMMGGRFLF